VPVLYISLYLNDLEELDFQHHMFSKLRREVIVNVCFVDFDGIVHHHCLNFHFIIKRIGMLFTHVLRKNSHLVRFC
jgi:hypothetical protein